MNRATIGRAALIVCGTAMLAVLAWAVADGVIYFKGGETRRVDHPVRFWAEAAVFAGIALVTIYTALTYKSKTRD